MLCLALGECACYIMLILYFRNRNYLSFLLSFFFLYNFLFCFFFLSFFLSICLFLSFSLAVFFNQILIICVDIYLFFSSVHFIFYVLHFSFRLLSISFSLFKNISLYLWFPIILMKAIQSVIVQSDIQISHSKRFNRMKTSWPEKTWVT